MDDGIKTAFEFAAETVKQLITLSTGIVALTITFSKDIFDHSPRWARKVLMVAWIFYLVSIVFGIFALMNLTGEVALTAGPTPATQPISPIYKPSIQIFAGSQIVLFLIGTVLIIVFGSSTLSNGRAGLGDVRKTGDGSDAAPQPGFEVQSVESKPLTGRTADVVATTPTTPEVKGGRDEGSTGVGNGQ